jgi:hypothetical protein
MPEDIKLECERDHNLGPHFLIDANGVRAQVTVVDYFANSTISIDSNQRLSLFNSDPDKAVANCMSRHCHHFNQGKLYKCPIIGILPDFNQQFYLDITHSDQQLINSYQAAESTWSDQELEVFLTGLKKGKSIPQCKFCPETYVWSRFDSTTKKIKLEKKKKSNIQTK